MILSGAQEEVCPREYIVNQPYSLRMCSGPQDFVKDIVYTRAGREDVIKASLTYLYNKKTFAKKDDYCVDAEVHQVVVNDRDNSDTLSITTDCHKDFLHGWGVSLDYSSFCGSNWVHKTTKICFDVYYKGWTVSYNKPNSSDRINWRCAVVGQIIPAEGEFFCNSKGVELTYDIFATEHETYCAKIEAPFDNLSQATLMWGIRGQSGFQKKEWTILNF